ncbi:MAG TPA: cell division protein ZapD [Gammaproteobacteria bacterium]
MFVVGLTGGIGSGKSTIAKLFAEHNVPIIDADLIARELVEPGQAALEEIVDTFGPDVLNRDGTLDRRKLRARVFEDAGQRKRLEAILHPRIRHDMMERLEAVNAPYAVMVIPLLIDTGYWNMIDRILVVDVDEEDQLQRVMQRDGVTREQAQAIVDTQVSREDRLVAADDVIENHSDITALRKQVDALHERYVQRSLKEANEASINSISGRTVSTDSFIAYEQPLNERIRTFLRFENLYVRMSSHVAGNTMADDHGAITTLAEISNLISRGDFKSEVMKELERQHASVKRHCDMPGVDQEKLGKLLSRQSALLDRLHASQEQLGYHLRSDSLFNNVRQRLNIPGGTCDFDLPVYAYWLNRPAAERTGTLEGWLKPFEAVAQAIALCLETIRNSTDPLPHLARKGYYDQPLETDVQLIRVLLDKSLAVYPTISAGKHRFNIRFIDWLPDEPRSPQTESDIDFQLMICGV